MTLSRPETKWMDVLLTYKMYPLGSPAAPHVRHKKLHPGELGVAVQDEGGHFWQTGGPPSLSRRG